MSKIKSDALYIQIDRQEYLLIMHMTNNSKIVALILIGTFLRFFFILYLSQFETLATHQLTLTDIDYQVYTDAAY